MRANAQYIYFNLILDVNSTPYSHLAFLQHPSFSPILSPHSDSGDRSPLAASAYALIVYPSTAYYNQYNTSQPLTLAIAVGVVIFVLLNAMYVGSVYAQKQKGRIR